MPKTDTEKRPAGWDRLPREGSAEGAQTGYCPERKCFYHVGSSGAIQWHELPAGFRYDAATDTLVPVQSEQAEQAREQAAQPFAGQAPEE